MLIASLFQLIHLSVGRAVFRTICLALIGGGVLPARVQPYLPDDDMVSKPQSCSQIVLAAVIDGNWEIALLDPSQGRLLNLSRSPADDRDPAWSPDGRRLAFASRRAGNWDVYTLDLVQGTLRRLTDDPAYDGAPAWSLDGTRLAFESYRSGNLDIYTIPAVGGPATPITDDPAAEIEPVWAAGERLIFGSWRSGARQLYQQHLATGETLALTPPGEEPRQLAVAPDGKQLAYVRDTDTGTDLRVLDLPSGKTRDVSSFASQREWPMWQPDSDQALLAFELSAGDGYPEGWKLASFDGAAWSVATATILPLQWEHPMCAPDAAAGERRSWQALESVAPAGDVSNVVRGLALLPNVRARQPRLAAAVAGSFAQLRQQTLAESGYDFLGALNDAWRGLDHPSGALLSWHKTGRAFDVRDWFATDGVQRLYISQQKLNGQTYFRIYLRAARQDGSQGMPLHASWWQTDGRLSRADWTRAGGHALSPPRGYFVDFTELAERHGWTRIPALTPPDGNWRKRYLDLEFWHYERRDQLRWYEAMRLLYEDDELAVRYGRARLHGRDVSLAEIERAGIP